MQELIDPRVVVSEVIVSQLSVLELGHVGTSHYNCR